MASTDKTVDLEAVKGGEQQQPPPPPPPRCTGGFNLFIIDVTLRGLLFAASVISLVVLVTADETKTVMPGVVLKAKFKHSPAFIYFAAALSVSALYSLLTGLASFSIISHPSHATKFLLLFAFWDVLVLGIVASAIGSASGVAYIGLKGNSHVRWNKICNNFDKFCQHLGSSIAVALVACVLLVLLSMLSTYSLHSRIPK